MTNKVKRPISVWIAQVLLAIFLLSFVYAFVILARASTGADDLAIIALIFVALVTSAFWGIARRKPYGRWLSIIVFSLTLIISLWTLFAILSDPLDRDESSTEKITGIVTQVLLSGLFLALILRIGFANNVKAFFSQKIDSKVLDQPPSLDA